MDSEETPLHGMEEVEAPATTDATVGRPGTGSGKSPMQCLQWPWTVVECRCIAPERSATHSLLPKTGTYLTDGGGPLAHSEALASVFMNRRIRNRTSGGVGGRRGWKHPRLLPDQRRRLFQESLIFGRSGAIRAPISLTRKFSTRGG